MAESSRSRSRIRSRSRCRERARCERAPCAGPPFRGTSEDPDTIVLSVHMGAPKNHVLKDNYKRLMDMLPHELQKKVKRRDAELEKLGFCTITGLPVGMTQEMFDEANRQVRMNKQKEDKDNEPDRLTAHLGETRQTI